MSWCRSICLQTPICPTPQKRYATIFLGCTGPYYGPANTNHTKIYLYLYFYMYLYRGRLVNIECQSLPTLRLRRAKSSAQGSALDLFFGTDASAASAHRIFCANPIHIQRQTLLTSDKLMISLANGSSSTNMPPLRSSQSSLSWSQEWWLCISENQSKGKWSRQSTNN